MTQYNVANASELKKALGFAVGGDSIALAPVNYGSIKLSDYNPTGVITIKSAIPMWPAHFDSLSLWDSSHLRIDNIDIGHSRAYGETASSQMTRVENSSDVVFSRVSFHGSSDKDPSNDGIGVFARNVNGFEIKYSSFEDLSNGAMIVSGSKISLLSNKFGNIRSDGLKLGSVEDISIDRNTFSDFHPLAGDHADAIQFSLFRQKAGASDIVISNNIIMQGAGVGVQGIFISDPGEGGYRNVLIENNLVYGNDAYHGIRVAGAESVRIIDNTVVSSSLDEKKMWISISDIHTAEVSGNISDAIIINQNSTRVAIKNNIGFDLTPTFRSLIGNLDAADSPDDLLFKHPDVGFNIPSYLGIETTFPSRAPDRIGHNRPPAEASPLLGSGEPAQIPDGLLAGGSADMTLIYRAHQVLPSIDSVIPRVACHGVAHFDHFVAIP